MRRSAALLMTCLLALVTGAALLRASALVVDTAPETSPAVAPRVAEAANVALVRQFYAAVNETLRTGDAMPLDGLVSAALIEHAAHPGLPGSRAGLAQYLIGLSAAFPGMRITVLDLLAQDDEVMARVRVDGAEQGMFLGIPLPGELAVWGPIDVFRMADGEIVEHWAGRDSAALLRALTRTPLALPATAGASVHIERLTYAPGSGTSVRRNTQVRVVWLESGALDVRVDGVASLDRPLTEGTPRLRETVFIEGEVRLRPGDVLVLPIEATYRIRNQGREAAVSMEVAAAVPQPLTPMTERSGPAAVEDNVTAELLASGLAPRSSEPITVGVGWVTLAPGVSIPTHTTTGLELFSVEAGTIGPGPGSGTVWATGGTTGAGTGVGTAVLTTGGGALFQPGAVGPWHNGGVEPLVLLIVTVVPGEFANAPAGTSPG